MLKNYYRARVNAGTPRAGSRADATRWINFINRTISTRAAILESVAFTAAAVVFILVCAVA